MARLVIAVLTTVAVVTFALVNTHHVQLHLIGASVKVRLVFLLMTAFLCGAAALGFALLVRRVRQRRLAKSVVRLRRRVRADDADGSAAPTDEEDDLCG